jgi:hypothetical protein
MLSTKRGSASGSGPLTPGLDAGCGRVSHSCYALLVSRTQQVIENLNTHSPASLYKAFDPTEARRLANKLEIHYTPKSTARGSTSQRSS